MRYYCERVYLSQSTLLLRFIVVGVVAQSQGCTDAQKCPGGLNRESSSAACMRKLGKCTMLEDLSSGVTEDPAGHSVVGTNVRKSPPGISRSLIAVPTGLHALKRSRDLRSYPRPWILSQTLDSQRVLGLRNMVQVYCLE